MGRSKWFITVICNGNKPERKPFERMLRQDIALYEDTLKNAGRELANKYEHDDIKLRWFDIEKLDIKGFIPDKHKNVAEDKVTYHITEKLVNWMIDENKSVFRRGESSLALIINRELFNEYAIDHRINHTKGVLSFYKQILSNKYFRSECNPNHVVCCYGGVDIKYTEDSAEPCRVRGKSCVGCNKIETCPHTCYWRLLGLMLDPTEQAYYKRKKESERQDERVWSVIPNKYISPGSRNDEDAGEAR